MKSVRMMTVEAPIVPGAFRRIMGCFATGVAVVTTRYERRNFGMTVNSLASVSLDPCLLLVCLARGKSTRDAVVGSGRFVIHLLRRDQQAICRRFVAHDRDKFEGLDVSMHSMDVPVLRDCLAYAICEVFRLYDGGDHDIVVGCVKECGVADAEPLVYHRGSYGHFLPATESSP